MVGSILDWSGLIPLPEGSVPYLSLLNPSSPLLSGIRGKPPVLPSFLIVKLPVFSSEADVGRIGKVLPSTLIV